MLIHFSVENHRIIRECATFMLLRQGAVEEEWWNRTSAKVDGGTHVDDAIETGHEAVPHALRDAAIFGAPGAGRTSLVHAMKTLQDMVAGGSADDVETGFEPFRAASGRLCAKPSTFEVCFLKNGSVYEYGIDVKDAAIHGESLRVLSRRGEEWTTVFDNGADGKTGKFKWNINMERMSPELAKNPGALKSMKRSDAVFLAKAENLDISADMSAARDWIVNDFSPHPAERDLGWDILHRWLATDPDGKRKLIEFMDSAGGQESGRKLVDVEVEDGHRALPHHVTLVYEGMFEESEKSKSKAARVKRESPMKRVPLSEASRTTKALLRLAPHVARAVERGGTLVVDEFMERLHTNCVRNIIGMFRDRHHNLGSAQFVFTAHDTGIVREADMNRDQVWIMDRSDYRRERQGGDIYPWGAFKERKGIDPNSFKGRERFAVDYLNGVLDGVPEGFMTRGAHQD